MLAGIASSTLGFLFAAIWLVLLITLGVLTLRKGHWVMFLVGLVFPIMWLVGAIIPPRRR